MSRRARRSVAGALSALAALVVGASLAWACTPSAYLFLSERGGGPGTTITVTGKEFAPGPVELAWSGAPGAPTTVANGPSFSVSVAVPDLEPGVHYLVATATDDFGGVEGRATRAFKVSVPAPEPTPGRIEAAPAPRSNSTPAPGGRAESRQAPQRRAPSPSRGSSPVTVRAEAPSGARAEEPSRGRQPAAEAPAVEGPPARAAREGGRAAAERPFSPGSASAPSQGSVAADLWSGFASGASPSLLPDATTAAPASGSGSQLLGLGLLGGGLVSLSAGLALAGLRRRRATARRS